MTSTPEKSTQTAPEKSDEVNLTIDGVEVSVPKGTLVIRAAEQAGIHIPRFCDHPLLAPVGACRQCLVDVPDAGNGRGFPKPQASCTLPVEQGMVVHTQETSPVADKAQHGVMEFLLINHPLDCPVCDKGGECPLQNQAMSNGREETRYTDPKRTFAKPVNLSAMVLIDRERCISCQRCTRFVAEIPGDPFIVFVERGPAQFVGIAEGHEFSSYFAGNTIQICPVGALTSSDYRFRSRPFDLVSTPAVGEFDACGAAIRVDHRRGRVMRRLSGNDPEVNEEWISDKDRFAFNYTREDDRLTHPMVRDEESGQLRAASWPEAFAVAARGLAAAKSVGVLPGGRLTREDAYAYAKFARVALGTNDIDFRARPVSAEEAEFLAAHVVLQDQVTYSDLEAASSVLLVGLEAEDEAATIFLRLRKANRARNLPVFSVGPFTTPGVRKMGGTLVPATPGTEGHVLGNLPAQVKLDADSVILVGERLARVPGALSTAVALAERTGARLAWVPRRAGDRGAVESGALPNLYPGGRPVADPAARVDLAAAWGVSGLPDSPGRDTEMILTDAAAGKLKALVIGGVELADLPDPAVALKAINKAAFVVSLELRESEITQNADVVLPVAPVSDKAGSFINWEGRVRSFGKVFDLPASLPDVRVLAGISEEMGTPIGIRTTEQAAAELAEVGPWDGQRAQAPTVAGAAPNPLRKGSLVLASWKPLIDSGRMQDGSAVMRECVRPARLLVDQDTFAKLGVAEGDEVTLTGPNGSIGLPIAVADLAPGTVFAPATSPGLDVRRQVGPEGSEVTVTGAAIGDLIDGGAQ
ncbi:MAG TPA: NADH-quinone oxidoreductase subunit G [Marmoricola sp.]|nr:NADH-quinone oxidoreductase subunit G [Marmoricola sp.]